MADSLLQNAQVEHLVVLLGLSRCPDDKVRTIKSSTVRPQVP